MESIGLETDSDGFALSSLVNTGRSNFSSLLAADPTSLNGSHSGGSFFGIFPENGSITTTPHTLPPPRARDLGLARAEIAVLGVVLALTTLGNGFVLWVLLRRRKHNAPMHVFMVNLCVADLVVAFFQVLPQLIWDITERFQGPDLLCRSVKYLQIVGMFASSYMIVAMTVDRHHAICCPLQAYRGGAVSRWNTPVMVAWGLAFILSIPQVFIFSRTELPTGDYECWGHFTEPWGLRAYVTWMAMAVFVLPVLIITICQIRIFREIHNNIYLKSERMVMTELRKKKAFFRFRTLKKAERSRDGGRRVSGGGGAGGGGGREGRGGQLLQGVNNNPHNNGFNNQAPSAVHYNSCIEHVTMMTTSPPQQQVLTNSDCQECCSSHELNAGSPCSLDHAPPPPPLVPPQSINKAMSKTVRMTLVIVLVYTICWSPFFIVQMWAAWDPHSPVNGIAFTILMLLASLNSCTNPWIYTAFSSSMSRELQNLLQCRSRPGRRGSLPDDSTTITHTSTTKDNLY